MENNESLSILEVVTKSSEYLERKGVPNYKIDAEWLVAFVLGCKRMDLYLRYGEILGGNILSKIKTLVMRRGSRIPLQHILGQVQFAGLTLKSDNRALIPRCETEFLVDILHNRLTANFNGKIADLGSGSGAIILALCSMMPHATGCGFDNSQKAISLAKENLSFCDQEDHVCFKEFDWRKQNQLPEPYDLIISNPPYLSHDEWDQAEPEVKMYDPSNALVAQKQGLSDIENVIEVAINSLPPKGYLALEFGASQAEIVGDLLTERFTFEIMADQFLIRRFVLAVKK